MIITRSLRLLVTLFLLVAVLAASAGYFAPALAGEPADESSHGVYWYWDEVNPVGSAKLVRNSSGISADLTTSGLPAGQAVTLWAMIFNNPEYCSTDPCTAPDDLFTPGVEGDFYFLSGQVIDADGTATFGGRLNVGDTSKSGLAEFGAPAVPLSNPYGAEVHLALHSHGPKVPGLVLKEQISTYLGGCEVFLGPNGFATDPMYLPDEIGECSTIQRSVH